MKFKMSVLSFIFILLLGFVTTGCGSVAKIAGIALVASEFGKKNSSTTSSSNQITAKQPEQDDDVISTEQREKVDELNSKVDKIWENSQKATDPDRFMFSNVEYDDYFGDEGLVIVMTFVVENIQKVTSTLYLSQFVLRKDGEGTLGYERRESGISDTIKKPIFKNVLSDLLPGDKKVCRLSFHTTDTTPNGWTLYYKDHLNGNKLKAVATISE